MFIAGKHSMPIGQITEHPSPAFIGLLYMSLQWWTPDLSSSLLHYLTVLAWLLSSIYCVPFVQQIFDLASALLTVVSSAQIHGRLTACGCNSSKTLDHTLFCQSTRRCDFRSASTWAWATEAASEAFPLSCSREAICASITAFD